MAGVLGPAPRAVPSRRLTGSDQADRDADVWPFDADASRSVADGGQSFRRRRLMLRVAEAGTERAQPVAFSWGAIEPVTSTAGVMHGIELTTTRDGKLLVWNGSLNNGDQDGQMTYSVNTDACAATGWLLRPPCSRIAPGYARNYFAAIRPSRSPTRISIVPESFFSLIPKTAPTRKASIGLLAASDILTPPS